MLSDEKKQAQQVMRKYIGDVTKLAALLPEGVHWGETLTPEVVRAVAEAAVQAELEGAEPEPFRVGNTYRTEGGELVRFVSVQREGTDYETMADEAGVHRYTSRDFGRVTGAARDSRAVAPLFTHPPQASATVPEGYALVPVEPITGDNYAHGLWSRRNWVAAIADQLAASQPGASCSQTAQHADTSAGHVIESANSENAAPATSQEQTT